MNIIHAIITRKSCRTFNGLHLDPAILDRVDTLCHKLSSEPQASEPHIFNAIRRPEIKLLRDFSASGMLGTYGVIKGARSFLSMAAGATPAEQVLAGYLFEKLVLECTMAGLDTCWLGGTFGKSGFQAEFNNTHGAATSCGTTAPAAGESAATVTIVSPLGHRTPNTRFAERIMRRIISADSRKPFAEMFQGISAPLANIMQRLADTPAESAPTSVSLEERVSVALECVRLAPSSTNSQPWRANVCRNLKGRITGIDMSCAGTGKFACYDMGIAYCHLLESAQALGINGVMERNNTNSSTDMFFALQQ